MTFPRTLLLLTAALAALAGCARRETPADAGTRTQTLLIGNGAEPADLDPHLATVLSDQVLIGALFEGLTALDERTTVPVPAAAERWASSADGLTWTFHLRPGLAWSNGEPLTAQDFVDAWRRALTPSLAAENAWYFSGVKNADAFNAGRVTDPAALGFAAPDARTLVITLEHPIPYLPALVSLPGWYPVNPRVLAKFEGLTRRSTAWTRAGNHVGNGAFRLKTWEPNARIVVEKNPHHWQAADNRLAEIVFRPIESPDVEERDYRAGQLHVTFNLPVSKIAAWRDKDAATLRLDPILQTFFLRLNTTRPPFGDVRVRRALSLAVDRDLLAQSVLQGTRVAAHALTPPGIGGYTARARAGTDFDTARRLLAEAGFPGGQGLPELELQTRNDELAPRIAEALQAIWQRELGVRVVLAPTEPKTWIENQKTLAYTVSLAGWTADFPDPVTFLGLFAGDSTYNWTGWKNAAYDDLLARAGRAADPTARADLLQQAEQLLLTEAPIAPVHYGAQTYLVRPEVKGWEPASLVFRRFQRLYLEK